MNEATAPIPGTLQMQSCRKPEGHKGTVLGGGSGALQLRQGPGEGSGEALAARGGGAGVAAGLQPGQGRCPNTWMTPSRGER